MNETTFDVRLAVYDLSKGMARSLSGQFLGPNHVIDIIPHTALIVYGREYFFQSEGFGIESENPAQFRASKQMFPIEEKTLGQTTVTQADFEVWCQVKIQSGEWNAAAYDLMSHNCNNFSHHAAIHALHLSTGVPDWILQVPQTVMSSPMGQMIRPMLEQMQVAGGGSTAPFANATSQVVAPPQSLPVDNNPWATNTRQTKRAKVIVILTPLLDAHDRPLLSSNAKAAGLCVSKIQGTIKNETDEIMLNQLSKALLARNKLSLEIVEGSSQAIYNHLNPTETEGAASSSVFALMLFRLVVLHPPKGFTKTSSFGRCVEWVTRRLVDQDGTKGSAAARSILWCTASNAYGACASTLGSSNAVLGDVVEAAMLDISPESQARVEVRQAAAAFLYNVAHVQGSLTDPSSEELSDLSVSLLCGALGGITDETDETTRMRRLLVAAKVVRSRTSSGGSGVQTAAKNLVIGLGFTDVLSDLISSGDGDGSNDKRGQTRKIAGELQSLIA